MPNKYGFKECPNCRTVMLERDKSLKGNKIVWNCPYCRSMWSEGFGGELELIQVGNGGGY